MAAKSPFELKCIDTNLKEIVPGKTRVQNYWGDSGVIMFVSKEKLKTKHWGSSIYAAVKYDNPNPFDTRRDDGEFEDGKAYCECPADTCAYSPVRHLYFEVNHLVISHLRAKFGPQLAQYHDFELVKVAIARHFDKESMEKTLEAHFHWYETYNPVPSLEWFHPKVGEYFPTGLVDGYDKEGNLLHFSRPGVGGMVSPAKVVEEMGLEPLLRMITIQHEEMKAKLREKGYQYHRRFCSVYDLKDLGSIDGKTMDFAKSLAEINKNHQLEIVAKIFLINAPLFFRAVFKTIALFMDERTRDKVIVLAPDEVGKLKEYIDVQYLPSFCGGKNDVWMNRKGAVGVSPPVPLPDRTHGVIGEKENNNLFPKDVKEIEKKEKEAKKQAEKDAKKK